MKVSEIMTRDVCMARPDHTIEDVARIMLAIDAGLLPVGDDDRLIGTITDRDIAVRAIAEGKGPDTKVREAMTQEVMFDGSTTYGFLEIPSESELISEPASTAFESDPQCRRRWTCATPRSTQCRWVSDDE